MKTLFTFFIISITTAALAQRGQTIDDLSTIGLNLDAPATEAHDIHYPNYRMGGGNGASRKLHDCLILDIRHSDAKVTLEQKLKVANAIKVLEGFGLHDENGKGTELRATVKGSNVVFYTTGFSSYMTYHRAKTRDGRDLNEVIKENLPSVRDGNYPVPPTGLVYVRDCRF